MFINTFENSNEYKLKQILATLKDVYGVELKLNERSDEDLLALRQSSEVVKNSIVSESQFNTYNTNPEYTKNMLIMEAVHLFLTEIAPKRTRKTKVKENAVPSTPPSQPIKPATTATSSPQTPGTLTVRKGNDTKVIPAAQLAGLQAQGYQVVGADDPNQGQAQGQPLVSEDDSNVSSFAKVQNDALLSKHGLDVQDSSFSNYPPNVRAKLKAQKKELLKQYGLAVDPGPTDIRDNSALMALAAEFGVDLTPRGIPSNSNDLAPVVKPNNVAKFTGNSKPINPSAKPNTDNVTKFSPTKFSGVKPDQFEGVRGPKVADRGVSRKKLDTDQGRGLSLTPYRQPGEKFKSELTANAAGPVVDFMNKGGKVTKVAAKSMKLPAKKPENTSLFNRYGITSESKKVNEAIQWDATKYQGHAALKAEINGKTAYITAKDMDDLDDDGMKLSREGAQYVAYVDGKKICKDKSKSVVKKAIMDYVKKKPVKESLDLEKDYQASMARAELYRNTKYAMEMMKLIRPDDNVQSWISSSLVKAADYLEQVFQYMDYYTKFEPEQMSPEETSLDVADVAPEDTGLGEMDSSTTGELARENLLQIVEYSTKLFNILKPGDKLEGWVAMKLTSASNDISNAKHYLDYIQFEKHASDHISDMEGPINEKTAMIKGQTRNRLRETDSIGQMLMKMMVTEDQDLAQAQALLAAKSLSDDLLSMAEKISKMSVDDLIPLVDSIRDQFGPEAADSYSSMMKQSLEALLTAVTEAKTTSDNAITQLQGGEIPGAGGDLGGDAGSAPPSPDDLTGGDNMGTGGPAIAPEPQNPLGRVRKDELGEAWKAKMNTPEKKKGMWNGYTVAELKAKKAKLMDKEERTAAEQTKVKEINFAIRAKQKNKWGAVKESDFVTNPDKENDYANIRAQSPGSNSRNLGDNPELAALMNKYGVSQGSKVNESEDSTFKPKQTQKAETPPVKKKEGGSAKGKFATSQLQEIKAFLNDKISYNNLSLSLREKLESMYGVSDSDSGKGEKIHSKLTSAVNKGDFGHSFVGYVREGTLTEKKLKAVCTPRKSAEDRNNKMSEFDVRNMKRPVKKDTDNIKLKEEEKAKTKKDKEPFNKAEYFAKKNADKKKKETTKKKVDESAPPGKKAQSFIKDSKSSFKEKYGKKWQERLYATAWKKFGKKDESYVNAAMQLENNKSALAKLETVFGTHKKVYKSMVNEGKADDPLNLGYGLEGELLVKQMGDVKSTITKLAEMIKNEVKAGAIGLILAEQAADKINTISAAKTVAPWGVAWKSALGKSQAKFFESKSDRDYWVSLKTLSESKLIDPEHFDVQLSKLYETYSQ